MRDPLAEIRRILVDARQKAGPGGSEMSQKQFAEAAGLKQSNYGKIEKMDHPPKPEDCDALGKAYPNLIDPVKLKVLAAQVKGYLTADQVMLLLARKNTPGKEKRPAPL